MAKGGRVLLQLDSRDMNKRLEASIRKVERGTKKATIAACQEIEKISLKKVPRSTNTLADSFFYEIHGSYKNFTASIGYGGPKDKRNPKTGQMASSYMLAVHEDLDARHPVGEAKFFENAILEYQGQFLPRVAEFVREELK